MTSIIRNALVAAAIAAGSFACSSAPNDGAQAASEPIIAGRIDGDAGLGDHPAIMALIRDRSSGNLLGTEVCTATLIGTQNTYGFVLTASHCFDDVTDPSRYTLVDALEIFDPNPTIYRIDAFKANPYTVTPSTTLGDIAVARFPSVPATLKPIPMLPPSQDNLTGPDPQIPGSKGTAIEILGYGEAFSGGTPDFREYAYNTISILGTDWFRYDESTGGGACPGDSGGPVLVTGANNVQYIAGVTSTAACDSTNSAGTHGEAVRVSNPTIYGIITTFVSQLAPPPATNVCVTPMPRTRCSLPGGWRCCGADQGWSCGLCY